MQPDNTWKPYGFGGLRLEIPSNIHSLAILASADAGIMHSNTLPDIELKTFQVMLGFAYNIHIFKDLLAMRPNCGFSSLTINNYPLELNRKIFNNSESENGVFAGIEPVFSYKRLWISLPFYGTYIFSSPVPFVTVSASLNAGASF
jgi:hypothetical protein